MAEEFEESEVIFPDHEYEDVKTYFGHHVLTKDDNLHHENSCVFHTNRRRSKKKKNQKKSKSVPVNIPSNVSQFTDSDEFEEEDDEGEMVPPHVIVGRRIAGKMMAFSVCTGNGRTLKGRDLSQLRNSVLRMTGFLET